MQYEKDYKMNAKLYYRQTAPMLYPNQDWPIELLADDAWIAQPKFDGVYFWVRPDGEIRSRQGEVFPNEHLKVYLAMNQCRNLLTPGMCGEILLEDADATFGEISGAVNSKYELHDFTYKLFDYVDPVNIGRMEPYHSRLDKLINLNCAHTVPSYDLGKVEHKEQLVNVADNLMLDYPIEGLMIKRANAPYKNGRCTIKERIAFKFVPPAYLTALVLDVEENSVHSGRVGTLVCSGFRVGTTFKVGTGFSHTLASKWWKDQSKIVGKKIIVKYKAIGSKDRPRQPVYMNIL